MAESSSSSGNITDISNGIENIQIPFKNNGQEKFNSFTYIRTCIGGPGVNLPKDPFYEGCQCSNVCNPSLCQCTVAYGSPYKWNGQMLSLKYDILTNTGLSQPVFECNSQCCCKKSCNNRLVQNGINLSMEVFAAPGKGWGLRTQEKITKGQFVCEYAGEVISSKEAKKRTKINHEKHNYIIVIREHVKNGQILSTHVDPMYYGNVGRFINHSCDPVLVMVPVRIDSLIPTLALFAVKDIDTNTELTFDYSGGEKEIPILGFNRKRCVCGSVNCSGYLPFDSSLFQAP